MNISQRAEQSSPSELLKQTGTWRAKPMTLDHRVAGCASDRIVRGGCQAFSPHFKTFGHERLDTDAFALEFVFVEHVRHLDERHDRYFYFGEWLWDSKPVPGLKPPIRTILDHYRH